MGTATKHNAAAKSSGKHGPTRLESRNGRLAFELSRTSRGVYVERVEVISASSSMTHGMLVMKSGDFERYLETDVARFEEPTLYSLVQRQVEEMLDANP